ncbi:glycosyltransferase 87 family protein [Bdellovibrionota bacterium FG-2]
MGPERHLLTKRILIFFATLVGALASIALIRDTAYNGHDFQVFWNASRALLQGSSPYEVGADSGMVFKYPPWILPFFVPLAFFDLSLAKWLWGIIEVSALGFVGLWVFRCLRGVWSSWGAGALVFGVGLLFWGLWAVHALDGQVALPLLALLLWAIPPGKNERVTPGKTAWMLLFLTTKVFTIFAGLGLLRRLSAKGLFFFLILCGLLSTPALFVYSQRGSVPPAYALVPYSLVPYKLVQGWAQAANSGADRLGLDHIRGRANQGLPGMILRHFGPAQAGTGSEILLFLALSLVLGGWWWWRAGKGHRSREEAWAGWLALSPVVHPLPWWHLFVWAFPLAVFAIAAALRAKSNSKLALSLLGMVLLCFATEKVLGSLGASLEMVSVKSWGVLVLIFVLSTSKERLAREK